MNKSLVDIHDDLRERYRWHGGRVKRMWTRFSQDQRAACVKARSASKHVLKDSSDKSHELLYNYAPEINLHDLTERGPDVFLDLLRYRATSTLLRQYCQGFNGEAGDHAYILLAIRTKDLHHDIPCEHEYNLFSSHRTTYGDCFEFQPHQTTDAVKLFKKEISAKTLIPRSIGELVLRRQTALILALLLIMEEVLNQGATRRDRSIRSVKPGVVSENSIFTLRFDGPTFKYTLSDLAKRAEYQKSAQEEYVRLLSREPVVLAFAVETWANSRPELVDDKDGGPRRLPSDYHSSAALFDVMHHAWKAAAVWRYISKLLNLLEIVAEDKVYKKIVLQELVNVFRFEFERSRAVFKRLVQSNSGIAYGWFYRGSKRNEHDEEIRIKMRSKTKHLKKSDPKIYWILRLCDTKTDIKKAVVLMKNLNSVPRRDVDFMTITGLGEREESALRDMAAIVAFFEDLSSTISVPSFSRKQVTTFLPTILRLDDYLEAERDEVDLTRFLAPTGQLLEPHMARVALVLLERHVQLEVGASFAHLYETPVETGIYDLESCYRDKTGKSR